MLKRNRTIALAGAALALSVFGGTGMAAANASPPSQTASQTETTSADKPESAADQAAQDAAVKAAGIDPNASNINYDDATGIATLDSGNDSGNNN
ncbi:MAG: hypothetical protein H7288_04215 [Kineosporiaceae bacterium]|nr:hypothetical protein [Aeromicrobium sp.]